MYYSVKRISNSDLSIAKHLIMGTPLRRPRKALRLGQAIHEAILEPEKFDLNQYADVNQKILSHCVNVVGRSSHCQQLLEGSREQDFYWTDFYSGVECKAKLDVYKHGTVIDFKTTSVKTQREFEQSIIQYEYDRQMAFYADGVGASRIVLVGISKRRPELFYYQTTHRSQLISWGRSKYRFILQKIKQGDLFEQIWSLRSTP